MAPKTIIILATLDTKGREADFLAEQIRRLGHQPLIVDSGLVGTPGAVAQIKREEVAAAGGVALAELLKKPDRAIAAPVMAAGAKRLITALVEQGRAHGIVSVGGTQGTTLSTKVMRALPYGFPKIMVSTMASGNVAPWVDIKDITMMFSVTDIMGLNPVTRKILANAAGAVCGMANVDLTIERRNRPLIAITTVGITTQGAMAARRVLEDAGYETIVFHAIGAGGRAMEQMMKEGIVGAVLDYSIIEVSNEMFHALLAGGSERLTTAGKLGLPQVIAPGALEVLVFNEPDTVPTPYRERTLIRHSPQITDVRLNKEEMAEVGKEVGRRLQNTHRPTVFMIPTAGYDSYAVAGGGFHDPESDAAFVSALRRHAPACVRIVERDVDIESAVFATEAARTLLALIKDQEPQ